MAAADFDTPRLQGFRYPADQVDLEEPIREGRALDLDMVGEAEAALERARRDALIHVVLLRMVGPPTGDGQQVLLRRYGDVIRGEPGQGHRYTEALLAGPHDVVGRIA